MKKLSLSIACATLLGLLASGAAHAHANDAARLLGSPAPASQAQRTVVITPHTHQVAVHPGEVVRFEDQGREFAFSFDGVSERSIDLAALAPAGRVGHGVTVFVEPDPNYH